jgi:intron-binding protein aquarius
MGERDLDVDDDFSRAGRVNNMLARRLTLLAEVGVHAAGLLLWAGLMSALSCGLSCLPAGSL